MRLGGSTLVSLNALTACMEHAVNTSKGRKEVLNLALFQITTLARKKSHITHPIRLHMVIHRPYLLL